MGIEPTAFSDGERQLIERVAYERGLTFEEAAEQLAKEMIEARIRALTGRGRARDYSMSRRTH